MYERFTDRARKVMQLANQESQRFNHEYIDTPHILLGIVKEGTGSAARILKERDVDLRKIRLEVEKLIQSGPEMIIMGKLPQTPDAKKAIEYAMEEARNLNQSFVGTEHLLLGLLRVENSVAYQVLTQLDLDLKQLREDALRFAGLEKEESTKQDKVGKSKTPAIDSFTRDITQQAREKKLTPVVGRDKEIDRLITVLCRRDRRNAILIGDSGAGKRTIVHGLAKRIAENKVRQPIAGCRIVVLDQALLVAGTKYRGQFEERMKAILNEMRRSKNVILFIPHIQSLTKLGLVGESGQSAFEMMKFALLEDHICCVGTCSMGQYDEFVSSDPDLRRLFQPIAVPVPSDDELLEILKGIKSVYESYHRVEIQDEALQAAIELGGIYLPKGVMPETAINLIDEASARMGLNSLPPDQSEIELKVSELIEKKEKAVREKEFDVAAEFRDQAQKLQEKANAALRKWESETKDFGTVEVQDVIAALSLETGIPEQDIIDRKNIN